MGDLPATGNARGGGGPAIRASGPTPAARFITKCGVLREIGPRIQWVHSYVTDDQIYCVDVAPDEASVREHAQQGSFPANRISQIRSVIDPTTAE